MTKETENLKNLRLFTLNLVKDLNAEQLNHIPAGFNNNIIWNLAHLVSAQQGLCYTRAGLAITVDDKYYTPFRPETKPERFINASEITLIKELLLSTIDRLELDYRGNIFTGYQSFTTRYNVTLSSIEDALHFLPHHEGLHTGYIMALKRTIALEPA